MATKAEQAISALADEELNTYHDIKSMVQDALAVNKGCAKCSTAQNAPDRLGLSVAMGRTTPEAAGQFTARVLLCKGVGHIGAAQTCNLQPLKHSELIDLQSK